MKMKGMNEKRERNEKVELVQVYIGAKGSSLLRVCRCKSGSYNLSEGGAYS